MPTQRQMVSNFRMRISMAMLLVMTFGCAGQAWKQASREDTPAAYYQFMRDHSDSKYVDDARQRLDFHKLKRNPTLAGFEAFRRKYPNSEMIDELHPALEEPAFEAAVADGSAKAYRDFLQAFANGSMAARAEGNAVYVESNGFGGDAHRLGRFALEYPESNFSAEAERTAIASASRRGERFDRVGLALDVAASTPEAKRVRQTLLDRIKKMTDRIGVDVELVPMSVSAARSAKYPQARIEVTHSETQVQPEMKSGGLNRPSILGVTRVVFRDQPGGAIIAQREFSIRVVDKAHVPGTSVLFSAAAPKYWDEFFVPMARWRNDRAIRPPIELAGAVVDVDAVGDRSFVLYENGDFEVLGLADPTQPIKLAQYLRGEDYKRWSGIKMLGARVAIFGEEGLELVRFTAAGPAPERTWNRGEIGRVLAITAIGDQLVTVGAKGMQLVDPASGELRQVMRRVIQGVDAAGDALVFADGETVYVSSLELLSENRVIAQMKLGRTFGPKDVHVADSAALVTGPGGALIIDVRNPKAPKALAKLSTREVGQVFDAVRVRGRTFLVGERGAILLNRNLSGVEEILDVGERNRVAVMGRHIIVANATGVQVVDASPWATQSTPAASNAGSSQDR